MIVDPNISSFKQDNQRRIFGASFEYLVRDWRNYNYSNWQEAQQYMAHNGDYLWHAGPMYTSRPDNTGPNNKWYLTLACIEQVLRTAAHSRPRGPLDELVAFVQQHNRRDCIINAIAVPAMKICDDHRLGQDPGGKKVKKTFKSTLPLVAYLSHEEKRLVRQTIAGRDNSQIYLTVWDEYFANKEKSVLKKAVKSKTQSAAVKQRKM